MGAAQSSPSPFRGGWSRSDRAGAARQGRVGLKHEGSRDVALPSPPGFGCASATLPRRGREKSVGRYAACAVRRIRQKRRVRRAASRVSSPYIRP